MGSLPFKDNKSVRECECCKIGFHEIGKETVFGFGGPVGSNNPDKKEKEASARGASIDIQRSPVK